MASVFPFGVYKELKEDANQFVSSFIQTRLSQGELAKGTMDQLKVNTMWLAGSGKAKRPAKPLRRKLSSRQKKALRLYEIPKECQKSVNWTLALSTELWISCILL